MLSPVPDAPNMAEDEPEQPSEAMEVNTEDPPLPELVVPREFQLEATMALCTRKNGIIDIWTGYGKTHCMTLPIMNCRKMVSLVISPLKKLQEMQVLEFRKYGLSALAINEDTEALVLEDPDLWKRIEAGAYSVLVAQAEQFFMDEGRHTKLSKLIVKRSFLSNIRFLFVDEAHTIYTAGADLYGLKAFQPAWRGLGDLITKLGSGVNVAALSGTLPKHIKDSVLECLKLDTDEIFSIKGSCNRPNITYAVHEIVGQTTDFRNLNFLISGTTGSTEPGRKRNKAIVFHDSLDDTIAAKKFQEAMLPENQQGKGVIRYYHAQMSKEYLKMVYNDFRDPNGVCEILHATECASTGLDIRDIVIVMQYGIVREMTCLGQRGGRAGRDGVTPSLVLMMVEPWVRKYDLGDAAEAAKKLSPADAADPDCPIAGKLDPKKKNK